MKLIKYEGSGKMNVRGFYEKIGADYEGVLSRLGNEDMIGRFVMKFPNDMSLDNLKKALEAKEADQAFRAAHTLKGVGVNLGFDRLYEVSAALTEHLRGKDTIDGAPELFSKVEEEYDKTIQAIRDEMQ